MDDCQILCPPTRYFNGTYTHTYVGYECLHHLQVVIERRQVKSSEPIVLGLIDGTVRRQVPQDESKGTHVAPQSSVVQAVEAIGVGDGDIHLGLHQQLHYVVTLLGDGIMKGCVTLSILNNNRRLYT